MKKAIELKNVNKVFGKGKNQVHALTDIDFHVNPGELVAVIGPSGSGKSTFLKVIAGLLEPTSGSVMIDNQDLKDVTSKELVKLRFNKLGFILQQSNLVPFLTVDEQFKLIEKIDKNKKDDNYRQKLVGLLDTGKLGKSYPKDLSGGERQRVAISTALYHKPEIILADEPTASLDSDRAFEVVELLAELAEKEKTGIVMVTHDERLLKYCHRVCRIEDGELVEVEVD